MGEKVLGFNEECWIIYGYKWRGNMYGLMRYESEGSPGSVDFPWQKIVRDAKKILGFNHTHPGGFPTPSSIDDTTMIGWVKALGKPLLCGIKSDGVQKIYLYERRNGKVICRGMNFKKIGNFITIKNWMNLSSSFYDH
jgi:hypothetical protein